MKEINNQNQAEVNATEKPVSKVISVKEQALDLIGKLGLDSIYYTADGYWFTQKALADEHAKQAKTEVKEYKK